MPAGDDAPVGPTELEEVAFLAGQEENIAPTPPVVRKPDEVEDESPSGPLPPLEELTRRLSPATHTLLDELFRAKFVAVRRVPKSALKS